jgi:hypothetical protein
LNISCLVCVTFLPFSPSVSDKRQPVAWCTVNTTVSLHILFFVFRKNEMYFNLLRLSGEMADTASKTYVIQYHTKYFFSRVGKKTVVAQEEYCFWGCNVM